MSSSGELGTERIGGHDRRSTDWAHDDDDDVARLMCLRLDQAEKIPVK